MTTDPAAPGPGAASLGRVADVGGPDAGGGGRQRSSLPWATLLALTGATALALQVVWQRLVSLHVGVEATASAVVVAATLLGLGIGSLAGGSLVSRAAPARALRIVAAAEVVVAVVAFASPWLLGELFTSVAPGLAGRPAGLTLTFVILVVPSVAMGVSLPVIGGLLAGGRPGADAGRSVGTLYAANSLGAAFGAVVSGWFLLGNLGYDLTARVGGLLALAAAAAYLLLSRTLPQEPGPSRVPDRAPDSSPDTASADEPGTGGGVAGWYLLYGLCGLAALALQQSMFRLVGATMRSNSYSFPTVIALYLTSFALGMAVGSAVVRRVRDPRRAFLWSQFGVGVAALGSLVVLTVVLPATPLGGVLRDWFNSDGYASGFNFGDPGRLLLFGLLLPALVVVVPVGLMGLSFPFVERIVVDAEGSVGRSTGRLIAVGTIGNVVGVFVGAFVLVGAFGTAGTHVLVGAVLTVLGLLAAVRATTTPRRVVSGVAVVVVVVALVATAPTNGELWARFVGADSTDDIILSEDVDCASVVERYGGSNFQLVINGASQNGYPFDDFHVLIGLVPSLIADRPGPALAVGFGAGSTAYGLLADDRRTSVTSVELCGGHYVVADQLAREGVPEYELLRDDPRHLPLTADGRRFLATTPERFDAIVVDTLRTTSSGSGQHFSTDFFALAADRLAPGGVFVEWIPTLRTRNSAARVFPHLVSLRVADYNDSDFMIGSWTPLEVTPELLVERFDRYAAASFPPEQRARLREFLATWDVECINDGAVVDSVPSSAENRDRRPRDEFYLDNGFIGESQTYRTCTTGTVGRLVPGRPAG